MPVIVREERTVGGKKVSEVKVYKSDHLLTRERREQAEKLDQFLNGKMKEIEAEMEQHGLLGLKRRKGVLKLWYEVGKRLSFVDDPSIVPPEDKKYVWRAMYDHAGALVPGPPRVRANERPENSHFRYCYLLAQYSWDFVQSAGDWGAWIALFDSLVIRNDPRVIQWLSEKQKYASGPKLNWLRGLAREIRREFRNKDTHLFSDTELVERLEVIFRRIY